MQDSGPDGVRQALIIMQPAVSPIGVQPQRCRFDQDGPCRDPTSVQSGPLR
jgi:hypothetical protein